jgi:hypothetical protein
MLLSLLNNTYTFLDELLEIMPSHTAMISISLS